MKNFQNEIKVKGKVISEPMLLDGKVRGLKFSVMTKHIVKTETDTHEIPTFHNVTSFDQLPTLMKGDWVEVVGIFTKRKYKGKFYDQIQATKIKVI